MESETNDDVATADPVNIVAGGTASFCGEISSASDVDVMTFTLPDGADGVGLHRYADTSSPNSTDIKVVPAADGTDFSINGPYLYEPGKPYTVTISTTNRFPIKYRILVCAHQGACP